MIKLYNLFHILVALLLILSLSQLGCVNAQFPSITGFKHNGPPVITSTGSNFGTQALVIKFGTLTIEVPPESVTPTVITANIPTESRNGLLYLIVNGINSNMIQVDLTAYITSPPVSLSVFGGNFTVQGYFLNSYQSNGEQTNIYIVYTNFGETYIFTPVRSDNNQQMVVQYPRGGGKLSGAFMIDKVNV
ncbi:hypothetical protein SAMD00019534_074760 [Acytostelium subglobosum LB1]|uniref:hypothetical protein n=1 Tax=Acytostelium subglobosum LB1 TaxID=1410327 RepID=UPI000645025C|nr:hypothetical protein SAMD00019534_074760 [Acytostelium subglobosum LB1]GAM24301.1 hypothetical protein SAMD00019534_074760 [Acytostelium subglobosum LB1]|eukprot:XP_012752627.1 hypothetical protein SAMD00019534_074760 [Acytostelium subglobosum LB1]